MSDIKTMLGLSKKASRTLAVASSELKNKALRLMAQRLRENTEEILQANAEDLKNALSLSEVMKDRLRLTKERIFAMADGIEEVTLLPDPVGRVLEKTDRQNGLRIEKISAPMGIVAIIYESRPNVTSDAAALCIKSGNACVLRGGKEAYRSSRVIVETLRGALRECGLDENGIAIPEDVSRESANALMTAVGLVDVLIPRGGAGLIRACVENAKVPCIQTGTGICHIYVDEFADLDKALTIVENAKTSRPSVCNAAEVCLVNEKVAKVFLPALQTRLTTERIAQGKPEVELRLDPTAATYVGGRVASKEDFDTEFLDYILAVKVVRSVEEAVEHVACHSTGHSEAIVTENAENAEKFVVGVDSAAVYVNASTRFTDGGEFGKGCEIGISTQKMHARGPMGLEELTTYKYVVRGNGQIR